MTADKVPAHAKAASEKPIQPAGPSWRNKNFQINWVSFTIIVAPPLMCAAGFLAGTPILFKTILVAMFFYFLNGFGITMGYHRLWSHRSYTAHPVLEWFMAITGAGAFQGSIKWWGRNHRIHHRYVDTDKDPYNRNRGFWYSHVGWMLMKQDPKLLGRVDISDLSASSCVQLQHTYYLPIAIFSGILLPTLVCGLGWGDYAGGYFYAALAKMVFVHHSTFFINSIAHSEFFGSKQNFSENHTSHDSHLVALVSLGEGYHNFHHEFAQDYRNGIRWYTYDPSKWMIRVFEIVGLAKNLVRVPNDVIRRNLYNQKVKQAERKLEEYKGRMTGMEKKTVVPAIWTWQEVQKRVSAGEKLIVVGDYVLDVRKEIPTGSGYTHKSKNVVWYDVHPGGRQILDGFVGKDATDAVSGGIYKHSEGAFNLFQFLRVANLDRKSTKDE
jgi:stearoyl-CoA desaturase (delta-9 desaturase)